jgi:hypothetical protein
MQHSKQSAHPADRPEEPHVLYSSKNNGCNSNRREKCCRLTWIKKQSFEGTRARDIQADFVYSRVSARSAASAGISRHGRGKARPLLALCGQV